MQSLKLKVENALVAWLNRDLADNVAISGVRIYGGHETEEKRTLPAVIVHAQSQKEADGFPHGTGVFEVMARVFVLTQVDDEDLTAHDLRVSAVQDLLADVATAQAAFNALSDDRINADLHVYDIWIETTDEGRDARHHGDVLAVTVLCQGVDGTLPEE